MRVLDGTLKETRYDSEALLEDHRVNSAAGRAHILGAGDYAYIDDNHGVHKVGNASADYGATSLHVYAPGWRTCDIFDEALATNEPIDASGAAIDVYSWGD